MRLWHYKLLPYLPDAQFRGQLRELVAIMHDWRENGKTNHILINRVTDYSKSELTSYFLIYTAHYFLRYEKLPAKSLSDEFQAFAPVRDEPESGCIYVDWHDREYLRVCMANLYEKYAYAKGRSAISQEEWDKLREGYRRLTGEDYLI